jgi:hypothetical protein
MEEKQQLEAFYGSLTDEEQAVFDAVQYDLAIDNLPYEEQIIYYDEQYRKQIGSLTDAEQEQFYEQYERDFNTTSNGQNDRVQKSNGENDSGTKEQSEEKRVDLRSDMSLDQLGNWLDNIDKRLEDFGNETLGVNIPVVIARGAVKAMKLAVKGAATSADVLSAGLNYVKTTEWYRNLTKEEQRNISDNFQDNFIAQIQDIEDLQNSFELQQDTPFERVKNSVLTKLQDKLLPIRNLQKKIEKFTGKKQRRKPILMPPKCYCMVKPLMI